MQIPVTLPSSDWNDSQKSALVEQIVAEGLNLQQACAAYGVSTDQLKDWVRIFRHSVRLAFDHQLRNTLASQGFEVDELSHAEFSGNLADIPVADLLQTIQMGRKDAHIAVVCDGLESHIWCQAGEIIDAESAALRGEDAVYRILGLERGSVLADFSANRRPRQIRASTQRILLEAVKHNDERGRLLRRIGDPSQVFSVVAGAAARQAGDLDEREIAVLSSFDGSLPLDSVIAASGVSPSSALAIAVRFFESNLLIKVEAPAPKRSLARTSGTYHTVIQSARTERPPPWVLVTGAVVCSSLGAVTAIAYADAIAARAGSNAVIPPPAAEAGVAAGTRPGLGLCPGGMVLIEGGKFFMGSDSSHPALAWARPAHAVTVDSFCMDSREVSVEAYSSCAGNVGCETAHAGNSRTTEEASVAFEMEQSEQCNTGKAGREQHPQNCVSFHQAARYCAANGSRLPTEAEWEFAARGTESRLFPWGDAQPSADHVNACGKECARWHHDVDLDAELHGVMYDEDDGYAGSAPVGSFPLGSTRDGVMDLIGNVFEWTAGGLYAYDRSARNNPVGPLESDSHVIRGGNFNSGMTEFSDPALRFAMDANSYSHGVGFRCASDPRSSTPLVPPSKFEAHRTRSAD